MDLARTSIAGWALVVIAVGAATTGCGGDKKASAPSSAGSSGATSLAPLADYTALLINAGDIGGDFTASQPPVQNPNGAAGVAQLFTNADGSRRIGDTILIVADAPTATTALDNTKNNYGSKVSGTWQPVDVGSGAAMISGTNPDNTQAITVLVFTEGRALTNLEFDSAPNDPMDPEVAKDIGRKQDAAIKQNLPG